MGIGVTPTIHFCGLCRSPVTPEKQESLERRRDELADAIRKSRLKAQGIGGISWARLQPAEQESWRVVADAAIGVLTCK